MVGKRIMSPRPIADRVNRTVMIKAMMIATIIAKTKTVRPKTMKRKRGPPDSATLVRRKAYRHQ